MSSTRTASKYSCFGTGMAIYKTHNCRTGTKTNALGNHNIE